MSNHKNSSFSSSFSPHLAWDRPAAVQFSLVWIECPLKEKKKNKRLNTNRQQQHISCVSSLAIGRPWQAKNTSVHKQMSNCSVALLFSACLVLLQLIIERKTRKETKRDKTTETQTYTQEQTEGKSRIEKQTSTSFTAAAASAVAICINEQLVLRKRVQSISVDRC